MANSQSGYVGHRGRITLMLVDSVILDAREATHSAPNNKHDRVYSASAVDAVLTQIQAVKRY
jgi:hypothetical protein